MFILLLGTFFKKTKLTSNLYASHLYQMSIIRYMCVKIYFKIKTTQIRKLQMIFEN